MRIDIEDVEQSTTDSKGAFAAVGVLSRSKDRHMLVMPLGIAAKLIAMLCQAGKRALQARGGDASHIKTIDFPVEPTSVAAGIRATGEVDLVLHFGQLAVSATLDARSAQALAEQLQRATAQGSARLQ